MRQTDEASCDKCAQFGPPLAESPDCIECIGEAWAETARTGMDSMVNYKPASSGQGSGD